MPILEPMTVVTDGALALANALFGFLLLKMRGVAARFWAAGFLALSAAAFCGGVYHGFGPALGKPAAAVIWEATEFSIGIGNLCLLLAVVELYAAGSWLRWLRILACVKFLAYAIGASLSDDFGLAIADSGATLLLSAGLAARALRLWHHLAAGWLLAGYGVSILAAAAQMSELQLHEYFNHNDLYHLVQLIAMALLYRAGLGFGIPVRRP
jgi:hypothetical protein